MNPWIRLLLVATAVMGGCAPMSDTQCRGANWYALGERDALVYALRPQIDQYAHQCAKYGVQASEKAYLEGWTDGERERSRRRPGGVGV